MGGATAPVDGSASPPTWMARVEKPAFLLGIKIYFTTEARRTLKPKVIEFFSNVWHNPGVEITYELTEKDFFDSMIAHRNRTASSRWSFRIMLLVALLAAGFGVFLIIKEPDSQLTINAIVLIAVAVFWGGCKWARPRWAARKQYRQQPSAQGPRTLVLDSTGMHWRWDGGTSDVAWENVIRYLEWRSEFLLYTSPVMFIMVPKRALSSDQVADFRSLLAQHVPGSNSN